MDKQLRPILKQLEQFHTRYDEANAEVKRLTNERTLLTNPVQADMDKLRAKLRQIEHDAQPAITEAIERRKTQAIAVNTAQQKIASLIFNDAQARIETPIEPDELIAGLNRVIGSKRPRLRQTFGESIVGSLEFTQKYSGYDADSLFNAVVQNEDNLVFIITEKQATRAWDYLKQVCVTRHDGGLAPPYLMKLD